LNGALRRKVFFLDVEVSFLGGLQNAAKVERKRRGCYQKGKDAHLLAHAFYDAQPLSGHTATVKSTFT